MAQGSILFPPVTRTWSRELKWSFLSGEEEVHTVTGTVQATIQLTSTPFPDPVDSSRTQLKRHVVLDLHGGYFGVGSSLLHDHDLRRGPYIERLAYQAWVQPSGYPPNLDSRIPGMVLTRDTPSTENATGSVSSSLSYHINANTGFFGNTPTAGDGGGITVGHTYNHSIKDFTFYNRSQEGLVYHLLEMTSTGDGHPYGRPSDLQGGFFSGALRPLPALAKSNVPIVGQCVWENAHDGVLQHRNIDICVAVRPSYAIQKHNPGTFFARMFGTRDKGHWVLPVEYFTFSLDYAAADRPDS